MAIRQSTLDGTTTIWRSVQPLTREYGAYYLSQRSVTAAQALEKANPFVIRSDEGKFDITCLSAGFIFSYLAVVACL